MTTPPPPPAGGPPVRCPKCQATAAKAAKLLMPFVLIRCGKCGEMWSMPERRKAIRENRRVARFPLTRQK